jgi:pepF/M3 family oligoendopeptidase
MRWNLDGIYGGTGSPEFRADTDRAAALAGELNDWSAAGFGGEPAEVLSSAIKKYEEYRLLLEKAYAYCSLRNAVDADDTDAMAWTEKLAALDAGAVMFVARFRKYLLGLGKRLEEVVSATPGLSEFAFFLKENREYARYMLPPDVENALSIMEITGSQAWSNLQGSLTSTLSVDMESGGEARPLTLPEARNLAYDPDPEVRRKAYEAELASYPRIERGVAAALNGVKGESIAKCRLRGFASPLDEVLFVSRMDRATLDAMIGVMEGYLPVFRRYLKAKAALLGKAALPFCDMFAPVGDFSRRFTLEEAREYLVCNFRGFSGRMADFVDSAFENRWLDTEPRRGKVGGAFCHTVRAIGQPRILSNFDGSFNSVTTLAHELGHGYHGMCMKGVSVLNSNYPMQLAETASIFNETFIVGKALEETKSGGEKLALLDQRLMEATQVIVDILSRYYFETEVFARRKDGVLGAEELKEIMLGAQRKAYGDGLDPSRLHPYMWICKSHYYMGINFYNFPYAFGLLFGLGVYGLYKEKGEAFLPVYDRLLASTGSGDVATVCSSVGINVRDAAFWKTSLDVLGAEAAAFGDLAGKPAGK